MLTSFLVWGYEYLLAFLWQILLPYLNVDYITVVTVVLLVMQWDARSPVICRFLITKNKKDTAIKLLAHKPVFLTIANLIGLAVFSQNSMLQSSDQPAVSEYIVPKSVCTNRLFRMYIPHTGIDPVSIE